MTDISRAIETLFDTVRPPHSWTEAEERDVIARAQAGDEQATEALLAQYTPAMKSALQHFGPKTDELDDARQNAMLGVLEAIREYDPARHPRLAGLVQSRVRDAVVAGTTSDVAQFAVPKRTLTRFFMILREAGGNVYEATALAPAYSMTRETFLQVLSAVRGVESYDGGTDSAPGADGSIEHGGLLSHTDAESVYGVARTDTEIVEDDMLVRVAFRAVDAQEETVIRHSYGFNDYEPQSDAEVAHRLGLSRPKVQRVRAGGLAKMRDALGVA